MKVEAVFWKALTKPSPGKSGRLRSPSTELSPSPSPALRPSAATTASTSIAPFDLQGVQGTHSSDGLAAVNPLQQSINAGGHDSAPTDVSDQDNASVSASAVARYEVAASSEPLSALEASFAAKGQDKKKLIEMVDDATVCPQNYLSCWFC